MLFLNFNYNLTHHRRPSLPWQELHARSDLQGDPADLAPVLAGVPSAGARSPSDQSVLDKRYF